MRIQNTWHVHHVKYDMFKQLNYQDIFSFIVDEFTRQVAKRMSHAACDIWHEFDGECLQKLWTR